MSVTYSITEQFGTNLAVLLSDKIQSVYSTFDQERFIDGISRNLDGKTYTQRVELFADQLQATIPMEYPESVELLVSILGEENPNETGMFKHFYWVLPIGKFIEKYGLDHLEVSLDAIEEVTKRNTGEYAIRPFVRTYPQECLNRITGWASSENFHLRRLASEGLRPKLPWSPKLDTFLDNPQPVFDILELLKEDSVTFVKKSVANHLTDWLKVRPVPVTTLIKRWQKSDNPHTRWIVKRATRKVPLA